MDTNKKLFPQRLWELIHDQKYNFCLRWSQDGQRVYLNRHEFEQNYLKTAHNQFHTQKAISFVRQMNMYGFRKVDDCYYENDNFKRNCPHLLKNMVRRHSNKGLFAAYHNHNHNHHHQHQTSATSHDTATSAHLHHQHHYMQSQHEFQQHISSRNSPNSSMTQSSDEGSGTSSQHQRQAAAPAPVATAAAPPQATGARPASPGQQAAAVAAAASVAATAAALGNIQQCFVEDAASSLNQIGAALAAINSHQQHQTQQGAPALASTLYHRLAALDFAASQQASLVQQQHKHRQEQQVRSLATTSPDLQTISSLAAAAAAAAATSGPTQERNNTNTSNNHNLSPQLQQQYFQQQQQLLLLQQQQQQQQQQQPHFNIFDIPAMDSQQTLAARQALQQTLIRYILQLKQQPQNAHRQE